MSHKAPLYMAGRLYVHKPRESPLGKYLPFFMSTIVSVSFRYM